VGTPWILNPQPSSFGRRAVVACVGPHLVHHRAAREEVLAHPVVVTLRHTKPLYSRVKSPPPSPPHSLPYKVDTSRPSLRTKEPAHAHAIPVPRQQASKTARATRRGGRARDLGLEVVAEVLVHEHVNERLAARLQPVLDLRERDAMNNLVQDRLTDQRQNQEAGRRNPQRRKERRRRDAARPVSTG
jgi:hypothetical protein